MTSPTALAPRVRRRLYAAGNAALGATTIGVMRALRVTDRKRLADLAAAFMRTVGPRRREHVIGRENLAAAFPQKSPAEIETILRGVWDNLGRVGAEFAHIDRLEAGEADAQSADILYTPETYERFQTLRRDGKPALIFAAHLANWELPALLAAKFGLDATVLYRRPNISAVGDAVVKIRRASMGTLVPTGLDAPVKLARKLEAGGHVAMLVDQYYGRGVEVSFFARGCMTNPLIARLARQIDAPIYGTRVVRLPDRHRFRIDLTEAIAPARDAAGGIDVAGTMQTITSVIEGWVREFPEQWLWVHRRWR